MNTDESKLDALRQKLSTDKLSGTRVEDGQYIVSLFSGQEMAFNESSRPFVDSALYEARSGIPDVEGKYENVNGQQPVDNAKHIK